MFISKTSKAIVGWTYNNLDDEKRTRLDNGKTSIIGLEKILRIFILYIMVGITLLVASNWIDKKDILFSLICVAAIRMWNGGHHFEADLCYLVTSGVLLGIPLLNTYLQDYGLIFSIFTAIVTLVHAPFIKKDSRADGLRKIVSLFGIGLSCLFRIEMLTTALFILSFDLIKYKRR